VAVGRLTWVHSEYVRGPRLGNQRDQAAVGEAWDDQRPRGVPPPSTSFRARWSGEAAVACDAVVSRREGMSWLAGSSCPGVAYLEDRVRKTCFGARWP
jgi:hypothetical protein